jgi:hypothetical protein
MSVQEFPRAERARRLRDQADELHVRAVRARDPQVRLSYLELARSWQQTADRIEGRDEGPGGDEAGPPTLTS